MSVKMVKYLPVVLAVAVVGIWLMSGMYTVGQGEEVLVLRFGQHVNTVSKSGLNWHIPSPVETVQKVNVSLVRRMEIGFKTIKEGNTQENAKYQAIPEEALMLTGDENLVNVETVIQYKITETDNYVFNVDDQIGTLKSAAESSIRRVIANHILDDVLTDNKLTIQQEIMSDLQGICDEYNMGIRINLVVLQEVSNPTEVNAAFLDVVNAKEDKNSLINEAESYQNEVIPKARGNAAEMLNKAEAYKQKRIAEAKGDVANFVQILQKYQMGKEVTRTRMYLETLEEILPGVEKYILDGDGNTLKFLPLEQSNVLGAPAK